MGEKNKMKVGMSLNIIAMTVIAQTYTKLRADMFLFPIFLRLDSNKHKELFKITHAHKTKVVILI